MFKETIDSKIQIWKGFPRTFFIYTTDLEFWRLINDITGFEYFSIYFYPNGQKAWQAVFPTMRLNRIEKLWSDFCKNSLIERQEVTDSHLPKNDQETIILGRDMKSVGQFEPVWR